MDTNKFKLSRRTFLGLTSASVLGIAISVKLNGCSSTETIKSFQPCAWLSIEKSGKVNIYISKTEMGQGISTALTMLIAEELECNLEDIVVHQADYSREFESMATAGSRSIKELWLPMRRAGAAARTVLIDAAARSWGVPVKECRAVNGTVEHVGSNKKASYGDLIELAKALELPDKTELKSYDNFSIIGQSLSDFRIDKLVNGSAQYGIDVQLPDLKFAAIRQAPFGSSLKSYQVNKKHSDKGILKIVELENAVVVVAESFWQAHKYINSLKVEWSDTRYSDLNDSVIRNRYQELIGKPGNIDYKSAEKILIQNPVLIQANYEVSYQAHATLEPMNCTVRINDGECDIWVPTQDPQGVLAVAKSVLHSGLSRWTAKLSDAVGLEGDIRVHPTLVGGGFGRRLESDFVSQAVTIAKLSGYTIKLLWSREQDIQHDYYRPYTYHNINAELTEGSQEIKNWHHKIIGPSHGRSVGGSSNMPYDIGSLTIENHVEKTGVPIGSWRGIGSSHNAFISESFIDEIAQKLKINPYKYRVNLINNNKRALNVLKLVAEKSGMLSEHLEGRYFGIAIHPGFGSYCAQVVEVSLVNRQIKLERITCAVDCGIAVNPDGVKAQLEGGILFGLSAAIKGEINISQGRVVQSNFHDYPVMMMVDTPVVDIHIVKSIEEPGGIGEVGVPPVAPALANAIFTATGRRERKLPFKLNS